jgi:hypothetical protein
VALFKEFLTPSIQHPSCATFDSVPARWPEPNAGVAPHVGGQHIWLLIFLVLFASRQKGHNIHTSDLSTKFLRQRPQKNYTVKWTSDGPALA